MSLLSMSFAASVLIVVIVIIRALLLYKLPKRTFLILWAVVLCRLLLPFDIQSHFSVYSIVQSLTGSTDRVEPPLADLSVIGNNPTVAETLTTAKNVVEQLAVSPVAPLSVIPIFTIVWLVGMVVCALYFLVTHLRWRREYRMALPIDNEWITQWKHDNPMRRKVSIRQFDRIQTPLTYGIWRPVVLLPKDTDWSDDSQVRYILAHEYTHIRRFDTLTKFIMVAALSVHWFNPLVWLMFVLMNRDIELSCDETVVTSLGRDFKANYALTLIELEERKSGYSPLVNHFSKNAIEERIVSIMKIKKNSLVGITMAFALVAATVTLFATNASAEKPTPVAPLSNTVISIQDDSWKLQMSADNGETWMSEEAFNEAYPMPEVVWWTYDEYKEWLDNEKIELQKIIGENGWTPTGGWQVWTQEMVDEAIQMYESQLEDIKNGKQISKTVDGNQDVVLYLDVNEAEIGTGIGITITDDNGAVTELGPYVTSEEAQEELSLYAEEQVKAGAMTPEEASELLAIE